MSAPRRVHAGVPSGGRFAVQGQTESGVSLSAVPSGRVSELKDLEPKEIDGQLAQIYREKMRADYRRASCLSDLHGAAGDRRNYGRGMPQWGMSDETCLQRVQEAAEKTDYTGSEARRTLAALAKADAKIEELREQARPLDEEFAIRGGWPRAFIVTNKDGHVHSSMNCSTRNRGQSDKQFAWMTDYSGDTEDEIVADAGWRACTLCYPDAPVGDEFSLPSAMSTPDEEDRKKAAQERADRKTGLAADRITKGLTPDGGPFVVSYLSPNQRVTVRNSSGERVSVLRDREDHESLKTERAAVMWYVDEYVRPFELEHKQQALDAIEQAVATKHSRDIDGVRAELASKVAAKRKREGL